MPVYATEWLRVFFLVDSGRNILSLKSLQRRYRRKVLCGLDLIAESSQERTYGANNEMIATSFWRSQTRIQNSISVILSAEFNPS